MTRVTITCLTDNYLVHPEQSAHGLLGEHGLAFLVEAGDTRILFDTGTGATLSHNARCLGVDLCNLDGVVLSHAHSDHTGGLSAVLSLQPALPVYVHPDIFLKKCVVKDGKEPRFNGMPASKDEYIREGARFVERTGALDIAPGMTLLGPIPRVDPSDDQRMRQRHIQVGNDLLPDPFQDEQVLAIDSPDGLILVLGCTHNGVINTLRYVVDVTGDRSVYAVVGGLHLCDAPDDSFYRVAQTLRDLGVRCFIPAHCTGLQASVSIAAYLGTPPCLNHVGKRLVLGS